MRLTQKEINTIKSTFRDTFSNGSVYLFGSRTDDTKKGGDIDLYIQAHNLTDPLQRLRHKLQFLSSLKARLGDQKIDILLECDPQSPIERNANQQGILL
jgi:predicted nucleotidyltransferase